MAAVVDGGVGGLAPVYDVDVGADAWADETV